jgi:hypothetical protein
MYRGNSTNKHQQITDHFEKNRGYQHLTTLMHELIQGVITVHLAPNLKPHSPNMFPTTGIARLNWSIEEWPRSVLCEKEEVIPDGNLKINEARSTRYIHHLQY